MRLAVIQKAAGTKERKGLLWLHISFSEQTCCFQGGTKKLRDVLSLELWQEATRPCLQGCHEDVWKLNPDVFPSIEDS